MEPHLALTAILINHPTETFLIAECFPVLSYRPWQGEDGLLSPALHSRAALGAGGVMAAMWVHLDPTVALQLWIQEPALGLCPRASSVSVISTEAVQTDCARGAAMSYGAPQTLLVFQHTLTAWPCRNLHLSANSHSQETGVHPMLSCQDPAQPWAAPKPQLTVLGPPCAHRQRCRVVSAQCW